MSELTIMKIEDLSAGGNEVAVTVEGGMFTVVSKGKEFKSMAPTLVLVHATLGTRLRASATSFFNAAIKIPNQKFCYNKEGQLVINPGIQFYFSASDWKYVVLANAPTAVAKPSDISRTKESDKDFDDLGAPAFKDKYKITKAKYKLLPKLA